MALDPNINTRESQKFRDAGTGLTRVAVEIDDAGDAASETTLADFKAEAHDDSLDEQGLLVQIRDNVDTVEALLTAIDGNTNGIETLIGTTNTNLGTVNSNLVTVQGKQDTGNTSLSSIDTKVSTAANQSTLNTRAGDLTETAPASDTASSGLNGRLQRIAQNITTANGKLDTIVLGIPQKPPNGSAQTTQKTITTTPSKCCVSTTPLSNRALLMMEPADNNIVWSFDSGMTYYHKLFKDGMIVLDLGPAIDVWVKTTTGSVALTISEVAVG